MLRASARGPEWWEALLPVVLLAPTDAAPAVAARGLALVGGLGAEHCGAQNGADISAQQAGPASHMYFLNLSLLNKLNSCAWTMSI
jgi:hypothetical protein